MAEYKEEAGLNFEAEKDEDLVCLLDELRKISDDYLDPIIRKWTKRYLPLYHNRLTLPSFDPYKIYAKIGQEFSIMQANLASTVRTMFGSTPYFPIEARRKNLGWNKSVEVVQNVMDVQAVDFKHFLAMTMGCLHTHLLGLSFLEPRWKIQPREVTYKVPRRKAGMTTGYDEQTDWVLDEGLMIRSRAPWQCRWDPTAKDGRQMRWFYDMELISRTALKGYMGKYYDKKFGELKQPAMYGKVGKYFTEMANYNKYDKDVCVLIRLWLPYQYRYVEFIDGETVIRNVVAKTQKERQEYTIGPVPMINNEDPWDNTLIGVTDMQVIEQQAALIELSLSQELNERQQRIDNMLLYNMDVFPDPNMLIGPRAARIGFSAARMKELGIEGGRLEDLIREIKTSTQSADSYQVRRDLKEILDDAIGQDATARGALSQDDRTATEITQRLERHDRRTSMKLTLMEMSGLSVLGVNAYAKLMRFASKRMISEILGEDAQYWNFDKLSDVPGGVAMRFVSSQMMAGYDAKTQEMQQHFQMYGAFLNQPEMAKIAIERSRVYDDKERERIMTMPQPAPMAPGMPAGPSAAAGGGAAPAGPGAMTAAIQQAA